MTAKQLEQDTGCKIMVRGKGSMRDKKKEDQNRGKPNWEHLNEELHVLITVEDTHNRYVLKLGPGYPTGSLQWKYQSGLNGYKYMYAW